jgi:hypothetical protein
MSIYLTCEFEHDYHSGRVAYYDPEEVTECRLGTCPDCWQPRTVPLFANPWGVHSLAYTCLPCIKETAAAFGYRPVEPEELEA